MSEGHIDIHLRVPFTSDAEDEGTKATMADAILEDVTKILGDDEDSDGDLEGFTLALIDLDRDQEWHAKLGAPEIAWGDLDVTWEGDTPARGVPYGWKGRGQIPAEALAYLLGYCDYYAVGPGEAGVEIAKDNTFHLAYRRGWDTAGGFDFDGVEEREEG